MPFRIRSSIVLSVSLPLLGILFTDSAWSQTRNWQVTAGGTHSWNVGTNWSGNQFPNGSGQRAHVTNNITGNQTINLNQNISLLNLTLGDSTATIFDLTIANGTGGPNTLTIFGDGLSSQNGNNVISAGMALGAAATFQHTTAGGSLSITGNINNAGFLLSAGGDGTMSVSGIISGTGGLTKVGAGTLTLFGNNTYSGATTVSGGTLKLGASDRISNNSAVTVTVGTVMDLDGFNETVASLAGAGSLMLGSGTLTTGGNNSSTSFTGVISGSGHLTKTGTGTMTLGGTNTYTGRTRISGGVLALGALGSIASSSEIRVDAGATFDVSAVPGYTLASGQTLKGNGSVLGSVVVGTASTVAPGISPGNLQFQNNVTFASNGSYAFEMNDATGTAGSDPGWDVISVNGTLAFTATNLSPFVIHVNSLTLANAPGQAANFNQNADHIWTIATTSGISGFNPSAIVLNTAGFANSFDGTFSLGVVGNNFNLYYTAIPEPGFGLLAISLGGLLFVRRRRIA